MVWGSIISAGSNLLGAAISELGGDGGRRDAAQANEAIQREFAQNGVRWRVEDAKAAGIHPLFALGMQSPSFSPSQWIGSEGNSAEYLSRMGQDIGRAVDSTRTKEEREDSRISALALERAELQNDLLRAQIAKLSPNQVGPSFPSPGDPGVRIFGTGDARIDEKPMERHAAAVGNPHLEAGAVVDMGFSRTPTGYAIVPSKDWKDRGEDQFVPEVTWAIRNHLLPSISPSRYGMPPPETWLPEGAERWRFDRLKQEWQPHFTNKGQSRVRYSID